MCREPNRGVSAVALSYTLLPGKALAQGGQGEDQRGLSAGSPELN